MGGQFERDQIVLEQYDRVRPHFSLVLMYTYRVSVRDANAQLGIACLETMTKRLCF